MNTELIIGVAIVLLLIALLIISIMTKIEMRKSISKLHQGESFEVQIFPWKENIEEGTFLKKQSIRIGYKYQLFVNGIPCFEPHIQVHETLIATKLDKESINIAVLGLKETISALSNIHPAIKAVGDSANIAQTLLALVPKNRR
jgi:hypothetical protein